VHLLEPLLALGLVAVVPPLVVAVANLGSLGPLGGMICWMTPLLM